MSTDLSLLAPTGWPTTTRPLRIVILGWAKLSLQARQGTGYNLSASDLAAGLALCGHQVYYLNSGRCYSFVPSTFVKHTESWRGVECYSLFNSPNLSPTARNFGNLEAEMSNPKQTQIVLRWLDQIKAQVVHIHSLEGSSLDLIPAIRKTGRPVIVTTHDCYYACPQVNLLYQGVQVCMDYQGGQRCASCVNGAPRWKMKVKARTIQTVERNWGYEFENIVRTIVHIARVQRHKLLKSDAKNSASPKLHLPDPELSLGFHVDDADLHEGLIQHNLGLEPHEQPIELNPCSLDANEQFLNAKHHTIAVNEYGARRLAGIAALNQASLVTPPSDFLRRMYISMGLEEKRTQIVPYGQPHFDQINRKVRRSPFYRVRPWEPHSATRPLRFGYLGSTAPTKGLEVLVRAIPLLPKDIRQRCHFVIRAGGDSDWFFRKRLSSYPEVSFLGPYDILQLISFTGEYDVGILPHLWFENSPLVLLEHLHAGKFVITSRLGGPVEWIEPPKNGLLFAAGQPEQLAECISKLITGEVSIPSPQEIHELSRLQSYPDHVQQVESIYYKLLQVEETSSH